MAISIPPPNLPPLPPLHHPWNLRPFPPLKGGLILALGAKMGDKNIIFNFVGTYVCAQEGPSFLSLCKRIRVYGILRFTIVMISLKRFGFKWSVILCANCYSFKTSHECPRIKKRTTKLFAHKLSKFSTKSSIANSLGVAVFTNPKGGER